MNKNEDIKITPQIVDDELLFYFTPKSIEFYNLDKTSSAYFFSGHFMNCILTSHIDHPGKIGLVGENFETIKTTLAMVLQGYEEYIRTNFLKNITPQQFNCQAMYTPPVESSPEQDPLETKPV
jgi:hypothetical protein